jgi:phytoene dehydrogenase-like protein
MSRVIVIGAGMGGLVAGNLLAKKGHKVTIFESHSTPGGYTGGFWRNGYYFESGTMSFEDSRHIFEMMNELGLSDKVSFARHRYRFVSDGLDYEPKTYEDIKAMIGRSYPAHKEELRRYWKALDPVYYAIKSVNDRKISIRKFLGALRLFMAYKKYKDVTGVEFAEQFFPKGSAVLEEMRKTVYPGMSPFLTGAFYFSFLDDYWTVKEGMQKWADALAENFKKLGGELRPGSLVDKIIVKDGAASGVQCGNSTFEADYVISSGDYKNTFLKLLGPGLIPEDLFHKIEKASVSESFFFVYLGLKISNEDLLKRMRQPYIICQSGGSAITDNSVDDESFFNKAGFSMFSQSLINPALAPGGRSSLMITTMAPYKWLDTWGNGDRKKYVELKNKVKNTLINKASLIIPDLKEIIDFQDAATPLTFEKFTHNTEGASSAWSWNPKKKFHQGLLSSNVQTPIKNLLIGSCWASQIGGVPGAIAAAFKCASLVK